MIGSSGSLCATRRTPPEISALAFSVAIAWSVVDPRDLLADGDHVEQVRVQPGALAGAAEGGLVQVRRAGGHHHAVQPELLDVLLDHLLAEAGAHELVVAGDDDVRAGSRPPTAPRPRTSTMPAMLLPQWQT